MGLIISEEFSAFVEISRGIKSGEETANDNNWHKIDELETLLSCKLFKYVNHKVILTNEGEVLYQKINKIYDELQNIEQQLEK